MNQELKPYLNLKSPSLQNKESSAEKPGLFMAQGHKDDRIEEGTPTMRRSLLIDKLNHYITCHKTSETRILREKQMDVFVDIKDFLEKGGTEGYVEAPTGFGKTVLFSQIIKATDQRTVIVVPTKILVDQTYERLKQFDPNLEVGRFYSDAKETRKKVSITTYKSLVEANGGVDPTKIDLVILDEAHKSLTERRIEAVGRFKNAVKLGFTATPEYTQDKRVKKLLNNEIHKITLKEAVKTGLLSSFTVFLAQTNVDLSKVSINNGDYNPKELEALINIHSRNESAVELYKQLVVEKPELSKAVVNCVSIKHAKEVKRVFQKSGISAEMIFSGQNRKEREDILKRYKGHELNVLMNINILTEGFDEPKAALAINLRPTLSKVVAKQRGGRILRLDPENPNKHAVIIEYLDKDKNTRSPQITFAHVAADAQIINPIKQNIERENEWNQKKQPVGTDIELPLEIEGLNIITNTEQVLKVVNDLNNKNKNTSPTNKLIQKMREEGYAPSDENIQCIQPTDFIVNSNNLKEIFKGDKKKLLQTAEDIVTSLLKQTPNLIATRKSNGKCVIALTRTSLFFRLMERNGHKIKQPAKVVIFP